MYTSGSVLVCLVRDETSEAAGTGSSGGLALSTAELGSLPQVKYLPVTIHLRISFTRLNVSTKPS